MEKKRKKKQGKEERMKSTLSALRLAKQKSAKPGAKKERGRCSVGMIFSFIACKLLWLLFSTLPR